MTSGDISGRQSASFCARPPLYFWQVKYMKNLAVAAAAAALLGSGVAAQQPSRRAPARTSAPLKISVAPALSVESQNPLGGQYCTACHSERGQAARLTPAGFAAAG